MSESLSFQDDSADFWSEFEAIVRATNDARPISGAVQTQLDALDALLDELADTEPATPISDHQAFCAELDAAIAASAPTKPETPASDVYTLPDEVRDLLDNFDPMLGDLRDIEPAEPDESGQPDIPVSDVEFYTVPDIVWEHLRNSALKPVAAPQPAPVAAPTKQKRSGKVSAKHPRKSHARNRRDVQKCEAFLAAEATPAISPLVDTPHPTPKHLKTSRSTEGRSYSPSHTKRLNADLNDTRKLAAWKLTNELSKMYAAGTALQEKGALAFTLNLAGRVKAYVDAKPKKAVAYLQDRLSKALKAEFGHEVGNCFVVEVSPAGRVHIHGMLALTHQDRAQARRALERAGGQWTGKGATYQADARHLFNARGWASYCEKALSRTKAALGVENVLSMSRTVRRLAEDFWNTMRAKERFALAN